MPGPNLASWSVVYSNDLHCSIAHRDLLMGWHNTDPSKQRGCVIRRGQARVEAEAHAKQLQYLQMLQQRHKVLEPKITECPQGEKVGTGWSLNSPSSDMFMLHRELVKR